MAYANLGTGDAYPIDEVSEIEYKDGAVKGFLGGVNLCDAYYDAIRDEWGKWQSPIFMAKKYFRIMLEITDVRVEQVQDISEQDAKAEGISMEVAIECNDWKPSFSDPDSGGSPDYINAFRDLWDSLNTKRGHSWDSNPWVWVLEFKVVENG